VSFKPTFAKLFATLRRDPKTFPKKSGPLRVARAANLRFRGAAWRLVFTLDEECRIVTVLALGPHDRAYTEAQRRLG
jgi:mRNA-degrading endonuclease RelE of RelBE toxin-antitoxin system